MPWWLYLLAAWALACLLAWAFVAGAHAEEPTVWRWDGGEEDGDGAS